MVQKFVYLFFAIIGSFLINRILWQFAGRLRAVSNNHEGGDQVRWEYGTKPLVGGITFFVIFILTALVHCLFNPLDESTRQLFIAPLAVGTMGFLIGLADDAFTTKPYLKILGQIFCGMILISMGCGIQMYGIPLLDGFLTLLWVVGLMNSLNMLDNMDGVTSSVSIAITTSIFFIARSGRHGEDLNSYVMVGLVGALIGFLILNWHPSKIYMGDSGSQFIGAILAAWGIQYLWNFDKISFQALSFSQTWLIAILVFLPTMIDTLFVVVGRISKGKSPAIGGRDHTTHHLAYYGVPIIWIPIIYTTFGVFTGLLALYILHQIPIWSNSFHFPLILGFIITANLVMLYFYRKGSQIQNIAKESLREPENTFEVTTSEEIAPTTSRII